MHWGIDVQEHDATDGDSAFLSLRWNTNCFIDNSWQLDDSWLLTSMIITSSAVVFLPWWNDWYNILRKFSCFSQFQSWSHYLVLHSQAKNMRRVQLMAKVIAGFTIFARSAKELEDCLFFMVSRGRLLGRRYSHITREMCWHLSPWWLTAWRKFFSLQDFGCCFTRSSVCGRVDQRTAINRSRWCGDGALEAGICGCQMVPCGECLPVILFANRSL